MSNFSSFFIIICLLWEQRLMDYNLQTTLIFFHLVKIKKNLTEKRKYIHMNTDIIQHFLLHFIMGFDLRYRGTKI